MESEGGERHEVIDLRHEPGELSFEARVGGRRDRIWFRTPDDGPTSSEATLPTCLMPAMRSGGALALPSPISPRLLRNQREFQEVQRAWSSGWGFGDPRLRRVEVVAEPSRPQPPRQAGRVAAFFSGGVDSWSTVLDHSEITDLIFVRGFDLMLDAPHQQELVEEVEERMREIAAELGKDLHVVETNLRQLSDPLARWEACYGCALVAAALFLAPRFARVLLAGNTDYEAQFPIGTAYLVDHLWSTEELEIVDDGGRYSRVDRVRRIAGNPLVQRTLRVCWRNPDGAYNCGRCRKCLTTMLTLEVLGARAAMRTFPPDLDLEAAAAVEIEQAGLLSFWEDLLDAVRAAGRRDLEPVVEPAVRRCKRQLGLPPDHRRRNLPGSPPLRRRSPLRRLGDRLSR